MKKSNSILSISLGALLLLPFGEGGRGFAQNIGINTSGATPDASAILDVKSTIQGILIPRMTDAQRQALKDPATGLFIYNTTTDQINFYNGTGWQAIQKNSVSTTSAPGTGPGLGVGVNTTGNSPDASAILDVAATDKGLLIPRTTTGAVTPVAGLIIFNTTTNTINYYNGTSWQSLCAGLIDNNKGTGASGSGISINATGATPDLSAMLDISSSTKGLLIPRMTSAQRDAIQTPARGLVIYNNTDNRIENWDGTAWYEWVYTNCCSNAWTQKANFGGTGRYHAVSFSIGNKGYIGTGDQGGGPTQDFWEWDQTTNVWTQKANYGGGAVYHASGFSIGSKGYIGTGYAPGPIFKQDFWEYNPSTNIWTQKANFGGTARSDAVGFSIGTKGYFGTGYDGSNKQDFWEWNQATNVWTQKANFGGTARQLATGFSIGSKGYIGTGYNTGTYYQDFWEWDQTTNVWTQKANFGGTARSHATGFSIGTMGYIGTGEDPTRSLDFWEWNQGNNIWTQKANFGGTAREASTGFSIGNKGYLGTGYDGSGGKQDFWEYCPTTCPVPAPPVAESIPCGFSGTSFTATWTAVGSTTSYLDVATDAGFTSFVTGYNNLNVGSVTTYNVTGLTIGTTYYYRVRGANACGTSANSVTITVGTCSDSWCQKASFGGTARYYSVSFSIGNKGYIGTGYDGALKNDFWEWNQSTNVWTQKANFGGTARQTAVGFSIGTKGYIGTGDDGSLKQDFWEWDQTTNIWTPKANFGGTARHSATGFSIGKKGYIGTGTDAPGVNKQDFWEWDQLTNTWTQKANYGGTARYGAVGFSIATKGYIGTGNDGAVKQDFWEWDQSTNTWSAKNNFGGAATYYAVGFSIGNYGFIGNGNSGGNKTFYEWSQSSGNWTAKANYGGSGGYSPTGFSIGNKGYVGTGYDGATKVQDFYEYCPTTCPVPAPPVAASASNITATTFDANWIAIGTTTCYLDVATDIGFTTFVTGYNNLNVGNVSTYSVTGLSIGTTYYYRVRAANSCGTGTSSVIITVGTCSNAWTQKANYGGGAQYGVVGFSIGTKGYFTNGYPECTGVTWEWDQSTNIWTQKANYPDINRYLGVGFSIGTKGYYGTGYAPCSGSSTRYPYFYEFNPVSNSWTKKADVPVAIYVGTGFSIGSKGYIGMGNDNSTWQNNFYEYDPATDIWTQKTSYPGAGRGSCTSFSIGTKGYVGMGEVPGGGNALDFWEWDQTTNIWTSKANFGGGLRVGAAGFSIGSKGYVSHGHDGAVFKNDFWVYNPVTDIWTQLSNLGGIARADSENGFSIGTKGYVGTGYSGSGGLSDFWEYCPTDCPVPAPPVALTISCGFNGTYLTANWIAFGSTTSYLDVATDAGFTSFVTGFNNLNVGSATTYNVTGLTLGTTYYFRVRGANTCGTSANSTTTIATTFQDAFTSNLGWVTSNATYMDVDVGAGNLKANYTGDGTNHCIVYDLGTGNVSDTQWLLRFEWTPGTQTGADNEGFWGISSNDHTFGRTSAQDFIGNCFLYKYTVDATQNGLYECEADNVALPPTSNGKIQIQWQTGTTYYIELVRLSATSFKYTIFSDAAYSASLGTQTTVIASTVNSLRYLKIVNYPLAATIMNSRFDNIKFWNNQTTVCP